MSFEPWRKVESQKADSHRPDLKSSTLLTGDKYADMIFPLAGLGINIVALGFGIILMWH